MLAEDLILVTGATGNTGSTLLQQLETRKARVRAMVRGHPDQARLRDTSATIVGGNFDDPRSLEAALEGVAHTYLVTPSSPDAEAQQTRFAELAAAAGVRHLVKLSQLAADEASPVRYTITGPAAVTHTEMASAIAEAIGRPVGFVDVPPQAFAGALTAAGVPPWQVDGLIEDYAHYARGEAGAISPHVREVTGAEPHDIRTFARDYAPAFLGE